MTNGEAQAGLLCVDFALVYFCVSLARPFANADVLRGAGMGKVSCLKVNGSCTFSDTWCDAAQGILGAHDSVGWSRYWG